MRRPLRVQRSRQLVFGSAGPFGQDARRIKALPLGALRALFAGRLGKQARSIGMSEPLRVKAARSPRNLACAIPGISGPGLPTGSVAASDNCPCISPARVNLACCTPGGTGTANKIEVIKKVTSTTVIDTISGGEGAEVLTTLRGRGQAVGDSVNYIKLRTPTWLPAESE